LTQALQAKGQYYWC